MAEQAAGAVGIEERISRLFPGMVWPEFPWRAGGPDIPIAIDVAGPLLALFPEWAGDWDDFAPYLRKYGYTAAELPSVSVKVVSAVAAAQAQKNLERRAKRGLVCSAASGTSVSTFYSPVMPAPIAARQAAEHDDAAVVKAACKLTNMRQAILVVMLADNAIDKRATCRPEQIQEAVRQMSIYVGKSFASHSRALREADLIESQTAWPHGYWLTEWGFKVASYLRKSDGLLATWYERWRTDEESPAPQQSKAGRA